MFTKLKESMKKGREHLSPWVEGEDVQRATDVIK